MRIVVSGGNGFIGSHVVDKLAAQHEILVVDTKPRQHMIADHLRRNVESVQVDVCGEKAAASIRKFAPQAVVHLAAQVSVTASMRKPVDDVRVNLLGLLNVYESARDAGASTFVFASSGGAIYGDSRELPASETTPAEPTSVYGLSKRNGEDYLSVLGKNGGPRCVLLRFANVYGPRQASHGEGGVVAIFARRMLANDPPTVFGDGQQTRDFVYVKDVADAVARSLESAAAGPFNISSAKQTSLLELTQMLRQITGYRGTIMREPARSGEIAHSCLTYYRAESKLGWRPQTPLFEGLLQTVDYLLEQPEAGKEAEPVTQKHLAQVIRAVERDVDSNTLRAGEPGEQFSSVASSVSAKTHGARSVA